MAETPSGDTGTPYVVGAESPKPAATEKVADQVKGKIDEAVGAAQQLYVRATERVKDVAGEVDGLVSEKPYISVGVGVAAGLLVGVLLGALIAGRD